MKNQMTYFMDRFLGITNKTLTFTQIYIGILFTILIILIITFKH